MLALGSNYHGTMGLHPNHKLVTRGPYRFLRHPMNVVFPLVSIVLFLMSANWVISAAALILIGTLTIVRAPSKKNNSSSGSARNIAHTCDERGVSLRASVVAAARREKETWIARGGPCRQVSYSAPSRKSVFPV